MGAASAANTRRCQTFSARRRALTSSSSWVTPTSTQRPAPIAPTTSSPMRTRASVTRCTSARTGATVLAGGAAAPELRHRLEVWGVLAGAGQAVELGPVQEGLLGRSAVGRVATPRLLRRGLQRPAVREAQLPRMRAALVHGVEVGGGVLVAL